MKKIVIIGGNAAGLSAASQAKRQKPDWQVVVFEQGTYISYGACGIPYYIQGLVGQVADLITVTPQEAVERRGLDLKIQHTVTSVDPVGKLVKGHSPGGPFSETFDYLILATGASPDTTGPQFTPSSCIKTVNSLSDGEAIVNFVKEQRPGRCAVIGGGYIALEMLEAFNEIGLQTHLIHRREALARTFEKEISDLILARMEQDGIVLNLNRSARRIYEEEGQAIVETDQGKLHYDLVVVATGVTPNSALARDCGIELGVKGSIKVNEYMQTSYPYIYAAGDCAETRQLITGKPAYVALALKANKEGTAAGINACGGREAFPGVLGTAITKFCKLGIARTGLTLEEAVSSGFEGTKFIVSTNSKAHYYPGAEPLTAVLIADKKEGRLLGAQLVGPVDSVKRIDVYATAITAGFTLNDIFQLDLAYAPPFSPVYDPVVLSGRVGKKKI